MGTVAASLASSHRLACSLAQPPLPAQQKTSDEFPAGATIDRTATVAVVLSSLRDHQDDFGADVKGLPDPRPVDSELTEAQYDAWVRRAIELGTTLQGGLTAIVAPDEWVVIKPDVSTCYTGAENFAPGSVTDIRIIRSLITFLISNKCGARFTIAETLGDYPPSGPSNPEVNAWTTDWGGAFGGLSYQKMIDDFSETHPSLEFELIDLRNDKTVKSPVPGRISETVDSGHFHDLPRTIQQCDRVISVAPLKTQGRGEVSLTMWNYLGIVPSVADSRQGSSPGDPAKREELAVDLFSYHPADYALLGGAWSLENGRSRHCNVLVAGANALAVDAVGGALLGVDPKDIGVVQLAERRALSRQSLETIWVRGNGIEQAREALKNSVPAQRSSPTT